MKSCPNIHVITPLVSQGFRDNLDLGVEFTSKCRLTFGCIDRGPASVESAVDEMLAAPGVVDAAISAERAGANAIVIDCMLDPGIDAAREVVSIPVIGAGEAGLQAAAQSGDFSVVTVLGRQAPMFRALARRHALEGKLKSVIGIGVPVLELEAKREASIQKTTYACSAALSNDGAKSIVFGCTGMLGFGLPVAQALGLPETRIIDPLINAVTTAIHSLSADFQDYPVPERKLVKGFDAWTNLSDLMRPKVSK